MYRAVTLLLIVWGLLLTALLARNGDVAWLALPFLVYLVLGIAQSPSQQACRLQATRSAVVDRVGELPSVKVGIALHNGGEIPVQVAVSDPCQPGMRIAERELRQSAVLWPGEEATLRYTFQSERGSFAWKTARAVMRTPFGVIEPSVELPAPAEALVQPALKRYRPFPLRPQRTVHSPGLIPARLEGSGTDFWGVREYHTGDPLRRLDWRLTARHPHRFFTRTYEQEEIADIGLILDARRMTDMEVQGGSLFAHSARAAASLAEMFLRQGNRVSLLVYGDPMVKVYPGYGKSQLHRMLRTLAQVVPADYGSLNTLQFIPMQMFASRSLIIVLSPLVHDDWRLFPRLRAFGYQVLLISPDPIDYAQPVLAGDRDSRLSRRLARIERQIEISKITQLWIPVVDWQVSRPLAPLVRHALAHTHIQRQR